MEHAGLEPGDPRLTAVAIPGYQAAGPHHDTLALALAGPEVPGSRLGTVRLPRVHPARGARTGLEAWLPPARVRDVQGSDAITVTVPCAVLRHWHHRVL